MTTTWGNGSGPPDRRPFERTAATGGMGEGDDSGGRNEGPNARRRKAALIVVPLFVLGVGNVLLILQWDMNPVWGVLLVPPVIFISALGWIAIEGGIADGVGGGGT